MNQVKFTHVESDGNGNWITTEGTREITPDDPIYPLLFKVNDVAQANPSRMVCGVQAEDKGNMIHESIEIIG